MGSKPWVGVRLTQQSDLESYLLPSNAHTAQIHSDVDVCSSMSEELKLCFASFCVIENMQTDY